MSRVDGTRHADGFPHAGYMFVVVVQPRVLVVSMRVTGPPLGGV
jgi:hypothetical protein